MWGARGKDRPWRPPGEQAIWIPRLHRNWRLPPRRPSPQRSQKTISSYFLIWKSVCSHRLQLLTVQERWLKPLPGDSGDKHPLGGHSLQESGADGLACHRCGPGVSESFDEHLLTICDPGLCLLSESRGAGPKDAASEHNDAIAVPAVTGHCRNGKDSRKSAAWVLQGGSEAMGQQGKGPGALVLQVGMGWIRQNSGQRAAGGGTTSLCLCF